MNEQKLSDNTILEILYEDPQRGMVLLMEQYTGLIWHVVSFHIPNPEDIKECVNEVFTRFYFHRERFNLERASLPVYLTVIARNVAVSRYRSERRHQAESLSIDISYEDKKLAIAELQTDMERAMKALKPGELQVIRMKYYDGMTVQEIANSLNLPYETVKKRHYRGIRKLRTSFLLLLLLLVLFSVCVYGALRHFNIIPPFGDWGLENREPEEGTMPDNIHGIRLPDTSNLPNHTDAVTPEPDAVSIDNAEDRSITSSQGDILPERISGYTISPGVGINTEAGGVGYTLHEPVQLEYKDYILNLDHASYINNSLTVTIHVTSKTGSFDQIAIDAANGTTFLSLKTLSCQGFSWEATQMLLGADVGANTKEYLYTYDHVSLPASGNDTLDFKLTEESDGTEITFRMKAVASEELDTYPYHWKEDGGIFAVPRLEDGSLIIGIYPVSSESPFQILPALIRGTYGEEGDGKITVTCEDGTVLEGQCIGYPPRGPVTYYEWDFGKTNPGSYTLNIPYLYEELKLDETVSFDLNLYENTWDTSAYKIPGGSIWIESCIPLDHDTVKNKIGSAYMYEDCPTMHFWQLTLRYQSDDSIHSIKQLYPSAAIDKLEFPDPTHTSKWSHSGTGLFTLQNDYNTGTVECIVCGDSAYVDFSHAVIQLRKNTVALNYRWNQSFELPFAVK